MLTQVNWLFIAISRQLSGQVLVIIILRIEKCPNLRFDYFNNQQLLPFANNLYIIS